MTGSGSDRIHDTCVALLLLLLRLLRLPSTVMSGAT